jgi:hypothetical protein
MKVKIKLEVSEETKSFTIPLSELGFTDGEWVKLSSSQQNDEVRKYIDDMPEQPYWCLSDFETKE